MEPTNEIFQFYVFAKMKRGKTVENFFEDHLRIWERKTPSHDKVCRRIRDF